MPSVHSVHEIARESVVKFSIAHHKRKAQIYATKLPITKLYSTNTCRRLYEGTRFYHPSYLASVSYDEATKMSIACTYNLQQLLEHVCNYMGNSVGISRGARNGFRSGHEGGVCCLHSEIWLSGVAI